MRPDLTQSARQPSPTRRHCRRRSVAHSSGFCPRPSPLRLRWDGRRQIKSSRTLHPPGHPELARQSLRSHSSRPARTSVSEHHGVDRSSRIETSRHSHRLTPRRLDHFVQSASTANSVTIGCRFKLRHCSCPCLGRRRALIGRRSLPAGPASSSSLFTRTATPSAMRWNF